MIQCLQKYRKFCIIIIIIKSPWETKVVAVDAEHRWTRTLRTEVKRTDSPLSSPTMRPVTRCSLQWGIHIAMYNVYLQRSVAENENYLNNVKEFRVPNVCCVSPKYVIDENTTFHPSLSRSSPPTTHLPPPPPREQAQQTTENKTGLSSTP